MWVKNREIFQSPRIFGKSEKSERFQEIGEFPENQEKSKEAARGVC